MIKYLMNVCNTFFTIRRSNTEKLLAFGIWLYVCILLFDSSYPSGHIVINMGHSVKNSLKMVETVVPFTPHRPFDPSHPKMVILLAYQRVGSSFTGQIFNQNPQYFYMYEPIDGIYSAMYGIANGFAVPSDIAYYWNGTKRNIPGSEEIVIAKVLGSLLTCDFNSVPTEVLLHNFLYVFHIYHRRLRPYLICIKKKRLKISNCRIHIEHICLKRFGEDTEGQIYCNNGLWKGHVIDNVYKSEDDKLSFAKYQMCVLKLREKLSSCMPLMQKVCDNSLVRTTKTVRLNMETAEYMFKRFPNLRIIQLIRDPRAVALSRMTDRTFHGKYSTSVKKEARLYCTEVLEDIQVRKTIEEKFPGSVMQVIYENIVSNPLEQIGAIYSFLNETLPREVIKWVGRNTESARTNSSQIAEKWQDKMTFKVAKQVSEACNDLYEAVNYQWPQ